MSCEPVLSKKIRLSDAAFAIAATTKSLQNWLQRGRVKLLSPLSDGGWMEFSFADICVLAITRQLVDFGVDVSTASEIAIGAVKTAKFDFPGRTLGVWREVSAWNFVVLDDGQVANDETAVLLVRLDAVVMSALRRLEERGC